MDQNRFKDELSFWCSQLNISPEEFSKLSYADLQVKFNKWRLLQNLEDLKNKKLEFIRNYAIKELRPRSRSRAGSDEPIPGPSTEEVEGLIQARVSLNDPRTKVKREFVVEANTALDGISESELFESLESSGLPLDKINLIKLSVTEVGDSKTRYFTIRRGEDGSLKFDCPEEWQDFINNL